MGYCTSVLPHNSPPRLAAMFVVSRHSLRRCLRCCLLHWIRSWTPYAVVPNLMIPMLAKPWCPGRLNLIDFLETCSFVLLSERLEHRQLIPYMSRTHSMSTLVQSTNCQLKAVFGGPHTFSNISLCARLVSELVLWGARIDAIKSLYDCFFFFFFLGFGASALHGPDSCCNIRRMMYGSLIHYLRQVGRLICEYELACGIEPWACHTTFL